MAFEVLVGLGAGALGFSAMRLETMAAIVCSINRRASPARALV